MLDSTTIDSLTRIVGSEYVLTGDYDLDRYSADVEGNRMHLAR